mmetsp:Transcript_34861/g.76284  ORF Transcript_34861/g.76284 Transcript_34861/m.76284 type:complete len:434 (+) Transcript_34861:191-1492(+)
MKLPRIISSLPGAPAAGLGEKLPTSMPAAAVLQSTTRPHLVLHFDINETILVGDEAGGDTREDCLNKMISKSSFVLMEDDEKEQGGGNDKEASTSRRALSHTKTLKPSKWWDGTPIASSDSDTDSDDLAPPPLYTGWHWPPNACPYYRTSYKKKAKNFTAHDGAPYRPLYNELEKRVAFLPEEMKAPDGHEYPHALHHMLPAFFHTLHELKREGRSFGLVLRTFGSDLPDIADALNVFARGQHPLYPDFKDESLVMHARNMFRGRWRPKEGAGEEGNEDMFEYHLLKWSGDDKEDEQVAASGDAELLQIIENCFVAGIQDHYDFWDTHNNAPWAGKPVWTHGCRDSDGEATSMEQTCHHIFFDDNIHNDATDSIAAVRVECNNGAYCSLSGENIIAMQGKHLFRVPTVAPIMDEDWFLHRIREAEDRLAQGSG